MHELTLFAQVPNSRLAHVERALTTITGMPGALLLEHHLIYKPKRNRQTIGSNSGGNSTTGSSGPTAAGDFYYLQLVADILACASQKYDVRQGTNVSHLATGHQPGDVMELDFGSHKSTADAAEKIKEITYDVKKQKWAIRFSDLPEVNGKRPVTSRMIYNAVIHDGDPLAFVDNLGYLPVSEYILSGKYFVYHNLYITITRILLPKQTSQPFPVDSLRSLDPAESYLLQASIKVASANEQETMTKGVEELKLLRAELKEVIELEPGERLSLDTRVR